MFCDGERNDLWVNACFKSTDLRGVVYDKIVRTDVHKYAVHEASFGKEWEQDSPPPPPRGDGRRAGCGKRWGASAATSARAGNVMYKTTS